MNVLSVVLVMLLLGVCFVSIVWFVRNRLKNPVDYSSKCKLKKWRNIFVYAGAILFIASFIIQMPDVPERYKTWTSAGRILNQAPELWMVLSFVLSIIGCYYWAKYKSQGGWRAIFGLFSILGFLVMMESKDNKVFPEEKSFRVINGTKSFK